jgi:hypothetical protein
MTRWVRMMISGALALSMTACLQPGEDDAPASKESVLALNVDATAFHLQQLVTAEGEDGAAFKALFLGELSARNVDTGQTSTFVWSVEVDAQALTASSNRTVILKPGSYELALLVTTGNQQYAGTATAAIGDGRNAVAMTLRPVVGNSIENAAVVSRASAFSLSYDPAELAGVQSPQIGVIVDGGSEAILALNPSNGRSQTLINVAPGAHSISLRFYDAGLQVGRSRVEQESVTISPGQDVAMDLIALQGESLFELTSTSGDARFSFSVPAEVVDEAGGAGNLRLQLAVVGPANPFQERTLSVEQAAGAFTASTTLSGIRYGDVDVSLSFLDVSTTPSTLLGTCNQSLTLDSRSRTASCNLSLLRRAIIGGNLLGTVGIDVVDTGQQPVSGAVVSIGGTVLGITSGSFGTPGYLRVFLRAGTHTLTAASGGRQGSQTITVAPLSISNVRLILSAAEPAVVSGTITDGATDAPVAQAMQVSVEGPGRNLVTDGNGVPTTSFTVTNGAVGFRIAANATPSEASPVDITLVITGNGYVPTSLPMTIIAPATEFSIKTASLANPPAGVATALAQGQADATGAVVAEIQLQATETITNATATVTVPPGTVVTDANGVPLTGALTMDGAYFSPTVSDSLASFPGGFSADTIDASGNSTPVEFVTAGLISVEIADASGRQARNFSGNGIQISMEIPPETIHPDTGLPIVPGDVIPILSNDTATGRWFDEGLATVTTGSNGNLLATFNATHLSLWNLDFKQNRCATPGFRSRRITVVDLFGTPICAGKMRALRVALSLQGGAAPAGYLRVLAPANIEPHIVQFMNAPVVTRSVISIFRDANNNFKPDNVDVFFGSLVFQNSSPEDNLCPNVTSTANLFLFLPQSQLPGSC